VERSRRIERVADRLFEEEEAVLHVMGDQIASEKRRHPCVSDQSSDEQETPQSVDIRLIAASPLGLGIIDLGLVPVTREDTWVRCAPRAHLVQ